ncbi:MAG: adenylosuccinate synthetase [Lachnospiraceae bacterium]|nr:adenylosuccinate synthetase [Lachnospiraceae bacterium]MCM1235540.1 adenylosuccinate synthetase [Ruminococcus flavefaciens]
MGLIMVVGGQLGSEAKGKVTDYMYELNQAVATVRVGGPNSGHTAYTKSGEKVVTRCLPVTAWRKDSVSIIAPGSYIDISVLFDEIRKFNMTPDNLFIDKHAVVLRPNADEEEIGKGLRETIASTCTGTGQGVLQRVSRSAKTIFAQNVLDLHSYVCDTREIIDSMLRCGHNVIVEGTQGYGLSNLHTDDYPYCTSRDTTAAGFLAEIGFSPFDVSRVVLCLRTFPIRVGGNSGPMYKEVDWDFVTKHAESSKPLIEHTTVTNRVRRVGLFDVDMVRKAIRANKPTDIVMNFCDYLDAACYGKAKLTIIADTRLRVIEKALDRKVDYIGTSPTCLFTRN